LWYYNTSARNGHESTTDKRTIQTYHDVAGRDDEFRDHHVRYVGCGYVADEIVLQWPVSHTRW